MGNWPGVTVERKSGALLPCWFQAAAAAPEVIDLPGVYSLAPFSQEEQITRRFLLDTPPDVLINVVDVTHLERNLYLTLQLLQLGRPVVLALNMMDELQRYGGSVRVSVLEKELGIPVVPVCARTGQGLAVLMRRVLEMAEKQLLPPEKLYCEGAAAQALLQLSRMAVHIQHPAVTTYGAAALLLSGDEAALWSLTGENPARHQAVSEIRYQLEARTGLSAQAALTAGYYRYLERLMAACLAPKKEQSRFRPLDDLLVHSPWAPAILLMCLAFVFFTAFGWPGQALTKAFSAFLQWGVDRLSQMLLKAGVAPELCNLLFEGILPGICSVLSFLPPLMLLMFQMSLLEESGYLPRAAFLMDRPLRAVGLGGRSLFPFLMGFGCTVPAALSARCLKNRRERSITVALIPLMSCGAKLPVYALLSHAFFPAHAIQVVLFLYTTGILLAALAGLVAKKAAPSGGEDSFLLELPPFRIPSPGNALRELWHKCREFVSRTFTVILLATMAVWVLSNHTASLHPARTLEESMLGSAAGLLAPLLRPCGFGTAAAVAALLTGLLAKENIVGTLAVLAGSGGLTLNSLQAVFPDSLSAFSFLVFVLLYPPCAAGTATIGRELGKPHYGAAVYMGYLLLAWVVSAGVYQMGSLLGMG